MSATNSTFTTTARLFQDRAPRAQEGEADVDRVLLMRVTVQEMEVGPPEPLCRWQGAASHLTSGGATTGSPTYGSPRPEAWASSAAVEAKAGFRPRGCHAVGLRQVNGMPHELHRARFLVREGSRKAS